MRLPSCLMPGIVVLMIVGGPVADACTTCNPELRDAIGEHFATTLMLVSMPVALVLLLAGLIPRFLMREAEQAGRRRLFIAGVLIGAGLGGFLGGIVFHQMLQ